MTTKERDVVREMKEKERERRALLSYVGWPVSFESFEVRHGVLVERGCLLFFFVPPDSFRDGASTPVSTST